VELLHDPAIPLLDIYPRELGSLYQRDTIVTPLAIDKIRNQSDVHGWMKG
jgi:hypothetical protein